MVDCPKRINGYPVVESRAIPKQTGQREGWVICVAKGACTYPNAYEFVVAALFRDGENVDREWHSGAYCGSLAEAARTFADKCARYAAAG